MKESFSLIEAVVGRVADKLETKAGRTYRPAEKEKLQRQAAQLRGALKLIKSALRNAYPEEFAEDRPLFDE